MMTATAARVVVAVKDAALPPHMAQVAQRLAAGPGARIALLRVIQPAAARTIPAGDLGPIVDLAERRARAELERAALALDGIPVDVTVLVDRDPAAAIASWLRGNPAAYVVVGEPARAGLRRRMRRSVADAVRRGGFAPVIGVHAPVDGAPSPAPSPAAVGVPRAVAS